MVMTQERYLTVEQAAEVLQVQPHTIRRWLRDGRLVGSRLGGNRAGWRIRESEIDAFVRRHEHDGEAGRDAEAC